ncbi:MAG: ABC transporter ATP-binding protein [Brevundimonas subvibrioides]|uniref:ABC transporter ATP-binding protein n=1 Tax=Brevundimonas subvibrioides TaxID=74313 RepID=A0A258HJU3_9CAUL|nr:ATP-binding cassette domain-containing protein [Brevundimonas subvibrioides]OYX56622.1 MAG: ABC transporter ATP-binding protein [Brevundimonas subvibrioides]
MKPTTAHTGDPTLEALLAEQRRAQGGRLRLAALSAALVSGASVALLGLSGWFITGAAIAGAGGFAVVQAFNYLLPAAVIRMLAIVRTGSRYVERVSGHAAALKALARLRPLLFARLAAAPPRRAFSLSSGEASARMIQDVDAIQTVFVRLSGPWGAGAGALAAIGLALLAGALPALVLAGGIAIAIFGGLLIGRRVADPAGRRVQVAMGLFKDRLSALQAAAPELRAYGLESWAADQVGQAARTLDRRRVADAVAGGWIPVFQAAVLAVTVIGVIATSAPASLPLVALAALASVTGLEAAAALTGGLRQNGAAQEALARLAEVLDDPARPVIRQLAPAMAGDAIVIRSAALEIAPPFRLGVIGPSGSGKTRLIETLMGLRPSVADQLRLGGLPLEDAALDDVRARFAYASQDVRLLAGSIADNLRLADPGASNDDLWAALSDACLADRVAALPAGLDTVLSENGDRLSGGERRRLGLARAYLRDAPWLVLDEPTEGLDAATETRVLDGLTHHLSTRRQGLILVSHRSAPTALCDRVVDVSVTLSPGGIPLGGRDVRAAA